MSSDQRLKLARLGRIRAQRTHSLERELAERRSVRVTAENALARQQSALLAAAHALDRDTRTIAVTMMEQMLTGEQIVNYLTFVERGRSGVATDQGALATSRAIVETIRQDEQKARIAVRNAVVAERKVEKISQVVEVSDRRAEDARAEVAVDELNSSSAARAAAGKK